MAVYLLLGDDDERKARGVERLRAGRSTETFDASDASPEAVLSACNATTLFGDGTFVLVRNLDAWNAAQKARIVSYLENPAPETDLILLAEKLPARDRLLTAAKKSGEVHTFEKPTGEELVKWAIGHARKQGVELPKEAARSLVARCSEDKVRLVREIEKLALYAEDGAATVEDVDTLCAPDVQSNIFAFVDSLAAGERGKAVEALKNLISTGEPLLRVTYMIRRQFKLVARSKALRERGASGSEISKELKVPPFVARKLEDQGRKLSDEDLDRALEQVFELERGLKGGSDLTDGLQVELAVLELSEARG